LAALVVFALSAFNSLVTNAKAAATKATKEAAYKAEVDKFWADERAAFKAACDEIRAYETAEAAEAAEAALDAKLAATKAAIAEILANHKDAADLAAAFEARFY
jgi:hypothetical protein